MSEHNLSKTVLDAMIAIQSEVQNPLKLAKGNNYTYVELDALLDVVRPVATKHGVAIVQHVDGEHLVTELWHTSGDSKTFRMPLKPSGLRGGSEAQMMGAAVTYARKYSLMCLFAIHGDKDEDAQPAKRDVSLSHAQKASPTPDLATIAANLSEAKKKSYLALTADPAWDRYVTETAKANGLPESEVTRFAIMKPEVVSEKFNEWKGSHE